MVDGETSVMMVMRSPPNPHPGRVQERSFWFQIVVSDGGRAVEVYLGKTLNPRSF
jgi:hypothetical protein